MSPGTSRTRVRRHGPFLGAVIGMIAPLASAATIAGRVTDSSGSVLPGVTIEAAAGGAGTSRMETSGASGGYAFADVPDGTYRVVFRLTGFVPLSRNAVTVSGPTTLDATLRLAVTADVVVSGKKTFANLADIPNPEESLIGVADSATQGAVTARQIEERPTYQSGEILESVPGLIVSQHSGEGKANQYFLRGFNLDHGTDFSTTVAGVPVNMPSHAHGQGYSDLNFLIPELVSGVQYRKGPYDARDGDFATAGAASVDYVDSLERGIAQASGGENQYGRILIAGSPEVGGGHLLYALEASHDNGPWVHPDNFQKYNGVLRFSRSGDASAFSVTAMAYQGNWNSTDQIPERALADGEISRFGAIDPTDGGRTHRYSLSLDAQWMGESSLTRLTAYGVDYGLNLFSNFTYFLEHPDTGDQFEQVDRRAVTGLASSRQWHTALFGRDADNVIGLDVRNDNIPLVGLYRTEARQVLSVTRQDHVSETNAALYFQSSTQWQQSFRSILGLREDFYQFNVQSNIAVNSGSARASIFSPKLSLVFGPWAKTELYANIGDGYHSNDARGTTITVDPVSREPVDRVTPLVRATGAEVGLRSVLIPHLQTTLALWGLDIGSELVFTGDAGTTEPSRPSRRDGIEWSGYWTPVSGLTVDGDLSLSKARYRDDDPDGVGDRIPGSVENVISAGIATDGQLFGSLRARYFGARPLIENDSVRSRSSMVWNARVGYALTKSVRFSVDAFNLFNAKVSDIDYYYASRLPGEPAGGVDDIHTHPAEPLTIRATVQVAF